MYVLSSFGFYPGPSVPEIAPGVKKTKNTYMYFIQKTSLSLMFNSSGHILLKLLCFLKDEGF